MPEFPIVKDCAVTVADTAFSVIGTTTLSSVGLTSLPTNLAEFTLGLFKSLSVLAREGVD